MYVCMFGIFISAFNPCHKCHVVGKREQNRTAFNYHDAEPRTNNSFRNKSDLDFHNSSSELEHIAQLDMVENFPIDPLHCCYLGVVKKLLNTWFGPKGLYSPSTKSRITQKIEKFQETQPSEFQRHLRGLNKMGLWKGTELRTFALFIGPSVLQNEISPEHYFHFMQLHIALTILVSQEFVILYNNIAKLLLQQFVNEAEFIYGLKFITYNMHTLTHIADDCLRNGPLDNFSAFKFESFLGKLKKMVKSPKNPIAQLHNRISEVMNLHHDQQVTENCELFIIKQEESPNNYHKLLIKTQTVTTKTRDSFVLLKDMSIVKVIYFYYDYNREILAKCQQFVDVKNIYELPIDSTDILCFKVLLTKNVEVAINIKEFKLKLYSTPQENEVIWMYPLSPFDN